jgi:hypothetical protein
MQYSPQSNFIIEFLCEFESKFVTALALESEDLGVLFAVKNEG